MQSFRQRLPREHPQLLKWACRFNHDTAGEIHPSRISAFLEPQLFQQLIASRRGRKTLSESLRKHHAIDAEGFFDFSLVRRRFALLDGGTLDQLAAHTTAAVYREGITKLIRRDEQIAVRAALGEDAYLFGLKRASFLLGEFEVSDDTADTRGPLVDLVKERYRCLECCFAGEPSGLTSRLQLKLPADCELDFSRPVSDTARQQMAHVMQRILTSVLRPDLSPCFN